MTAKKASVTRKKTSLTTTETALVIRWWDVRNDRYRMATGYVGENGIEANVRYRLDANHEFVRVEQP